MKKSYYASIAFLLLISTSHTTGAKEKPLLVAKGYKAFLKSEPCAESVKINFQGRNIKVFEPKRKIAARGIASVSNKIRSQCAVLRRVLVQGYVDDRSVYSGYSTSDSDWKVMETGLSPGAFEAVAKDATTKDLENYLKEPGFFDSQGLLDIVTQTPYECLEPENGTCRAINKYTATDNGFHVVAETITDDENTVSIVTYNYVFDKGLLCSKTADMKITLRAPNLTEDQAAASKETLRDRIDAFGEKVCAGYKTTGNGGLLTQSFQNDGKKRGDEEPIEFISSYTQLRFTE